MHKRNVDMRESLRMFDKVGNEFLRNAIELVSLLSRKLAPVIGSVVWADGEPIDISEYLTPDSTVE